MDTPLTKQELERKLARCLELAREFPNGSMAEMIRDMEAETREELRVAEGRLGSTSGGGTSDG
jgi:hypothetical protein